jgi:hypothetical protein
MEKYVYISNSTRIMSFLDKIQSTGYPNKLDRMLLESLGFKNSNDRPLIPMMKALGFVSSDGTPTERWKNYRDKASAGYVLAEGIREHYAELYKTYPDAHLQDNEALRNFFNTHSKVGKRAIDYMISTFKTLTENADFKAERPDILTQGQEPKQESPGRLPSRQIQNQGYTININIQLTLPETTNTSTYDAIFLAMKKHLLS